MQLTTLNRVISLFLVGGLVLLGACAMTWQHIHAAPLVPEVVRFAKAMGDGFITVTGGLLFISLSALCGALSEALTGLTVRRWIRRAGESPKWSRLLGHNTRCQQNRTWEDAFRKLASQNPKCAGISIGAKELAVGLFYKAAPVEAIACAESNYATYVMASNLAFLAASLLVVAILSGIFGWWAWGTVLVCSSMAIGLTYTFASFALDRYFSSYRISLRQSMVYLACCEDEAGKGKEAHNATLKRTAGAAA